jgi:DNA polymerase-1
MSNNRLLDIFSRIKKDETPVNFHLNSRVLIVDGMNTFLRGFAVVNKLNLIGHEVGGLIGFLKSLGHAIKLLNPTRVILVFDGEAGSANRKYLYPEYKANREHTRIMNRKLFSDRSVEDESKYNQITRLISYLSYLPLHTISIDNLEADDIIGYLTIMSTKEHEDGEVYIMSSDNDYMQLINHQVKLYSPTKKKIFNVDDVLKTYGVHPNNFILYKALVGDASDNIPGVNGVGEKNVSKLFEFLSNPEEKSLGDIYEACKNPVKKSVLYERILNSQKNIEIFQKIVDLRNPNISEEDIDIIKTQYYSKTPNFRKYDFMKTYAHDKMGDAIPNLDTWLNLFSTLNNYK